MLSELAECTVLMLKVIHEMYRTQKITYDEFLDYTRMKIQFLSENLENIPYDTDRKKAIDIIIKCTSLISQSGQDMLYLQ